MTARSTYRGRWSAWAFMRAAILVAPIMTGPVHAADTIKVELDRAAITRLPPHVATVVIGNPLIADVAIQSGGLVVVTGKGYGSTNMIVLDRAGTVLMERSIVVRGPDAHTVSVYRGVERETFSCAPNCERRITLGDSADYFSKTMTQSSARTGAATTGGQGR